MHDSWREVGIKEAGKCLLDFECLVQDSDNLREALRHSASMLAELRTSFLTPQKYFELYMQVFDKLTYLEVKVLPSV